MPSPCSSASPCSDRAKPDPDQFPLALHRSMEIDDLDREIQRLHDTTLLKRAQLAASQRLAQRGAGQPRRHRARDVRAPLPGGPRGRVASPTARSRSTSATSWARSSPPTSGRRTRLLLDWVRKQLAIAPDRRRLPRIPRSSRPGALPAKAVSRHELQDAELAYNTALASVALSQSREAQVLMELAAASGDKAYDPEEYKRLKSEYLKARVRYFEVTAEAAHRRSTSPASGRDAA